MAAAGFHPRKVLPCVVDVGTDNVALRSDPLYMGIDSPRLKGDEYFEVRAAAWHAPCTCWDCCLNANQSQPTEGSCFCCLGL